MDREPVIIHLTSSIAGMVASDSTHGGRKTDQLNQSFTTYSRVDQLSWKRSFHRLSLGNSCKNARYNSFFISLELNSHSANEFKNDFSIFTACYGTLALNISTLSFKAPLTSDRVKNLLADRVLRSVLSILSLVEIWLVGEKLT